jgi:uncharacterized protein YaiE (UPF0345 family)
MTKAVVPPPTERQLRDACEDLLVGKEDWSDKDRREALRVGLHSKFFITATVRAAAIKKYLGEEKK